MSDLELGSEEDLAESLDVVLRQALESITLSGRSAESTTAGTSTATVATSSTTTTRSTSTSTETAVVASEETLGDFDERPGGNEGRVGGVELNGRVANSRSERPNRTRTMFSGAKACMTNDQDLLSESFGNDRTVRDGNVIVHGEESTFLSTGGGVLLVKVGPQQDVDGHEGGQHGLGVADGLPLAGTELSDRLEVDVGDVLDLDLELTALLLDGNAGLGIRIRKVDDELVGLAVPFGDRAGREEVLATIVSSAVVPGIQLGSLEFLFKAVKVESRSTRDIRGPYTGTY